MRVLPPDLEPRAEQSITAMGCPDCPGTLQVRAEGERGLLRFECRIGHVYSLDELLLAKEGKAEERLWTAVLAFEEMAALLEDLASHAERHGLHEVGRCYEARRGRARLMVAALQRLAAQDRPLRLDLGERGVPPAVGERERSR
jgi:hypothetical protein